MSKPFITYTAQVEKLKNEKNLVITDDDFAVESLQNISYYALIGGYKHPFIDIHTRKYIFMKLMKSYVGFSLSIYAA